LYRQEPDNVELAANLAQMLALSGRLGEARSLYQSVIDRVESGQHDESDRRALEAQARFGLASVAFEEEDWAAVEEAALPLARDSSREWRARGALLVSEALLRQERVGEALKLLEEVAGDQAAPLLVGKRVEILLRSDQEKRARRLLRTLVASGDPSSALEAVRSYQRLGRFEESLEGVEELARRSRVSAESDRTTLETYYLLGTARERTGDHQRAAEAFEKLLAVEPDFAPALNYLGYMWAERGENLDRALELTQRAVEIDPDNGAYVDSLGWAHYQLHNYEEAREHLERAVKLTPEDSVVLEHLGDVYLALGIRDKARDLYQQALELEGENAAQIRRKLGELRAD
jgi:tetratricopeptide (TPR) repeat protein